MFSSRFFLWAAVVIGLGGGAGLYIWKGLKPETAAAPGVMRVAFLPFENQTGDASLDWPERLIPLAAGRQLAPIPNVAGIPANTANDAISLGATHLVYGYFTRSSAGPVVRVFVEEVRSRELVVQKDLPAGQTRWVDLISSVTGVVVSKLAANGKTAGQELHNDEAARRLSTAMVATSNQEAVADYESAVASDPSCGWCWEGLIDRLGKTGDAGIVLKTISESREKGKGMSGLSRARLDLAQSVLTRSLPERADALERDHAGGAERSGRAAAVVAGVCRDPAVRRSGVRGASGGAGGSAEGGTVEQLRLQPGVSGAVQGSTGGGGAICPAGYGVGQSAGLAG
ncbi:MAG: hypothetical protein QM757_42785 [Paludibaculum sp.]